MSPRFDRYAQTYDEDLNQALSISGEDKHFFAEVAFLIWQQTGNARNERRGTLCR
jgi:hypothetical protein